jgi:ribulose-5-phosphate 4-epimerase/fuculose-1-phosphate aldolase
MGRLPTASVLAKPKHRQGCQNQRRDRLDQGSHGSASESTRVRPGSKPAGHITVRDPEYPDLFWVNPFARSFRQMRVSDLILVNHAGEVVYGHRPVNRAAFVLHAAVHEARPDINAAAHAHSPYGKAAIHQNHGLFTVGETVDAAAYWFLAMERCCQAQLLAEAAGSPQQIRPE